MATDWTTEQILARIDEVADKYQVPRQLARAVATQESYLSPNAVGDNGKSLGLFQLQPAAAIDAGINPALRHEPGLNIEGGIRFLRQKYDQSKGDWDRALLRYNGGGDPNYVQNVRRHMGEKAEPPGVLTRAARWFSPSSADAAEPPPRQAPAKKWWDEPPATSEAPPPTAPAGKWWEDAPAAAPVAPQEPPAAVTAPQPPRSAEPTSPAPPTATSTPEQDAAYRAWAAQQAPGGTPTPAAPTPPPAAQAPPAVSGEPPSDMVIDIDGTSQEPLPAEGPATTSTPESRQRAQLLEPYGKRRIQTMSEQIAAHERGDVSNDERPWYQRIYEDWRQGFTDRAMQSGAHPASPHHQRWLQSSPMPTMREAAREVAATGIETGAGVLGTVAGAGGGPVGAVAGGVLGQSYGRRITNQLGLRQEEEPVATIAPGVKVYPSDLANAAFGVVPAIVPLAKQVLRGTMAGKAILAADDAFRTAETTWKQSRDKAVAAQKAGNQKAYEDAVVLTHERQADYQKKLAAREQVIKANQGEYDAAVQTHIAESRATAVANVKERQAWQEKVQARREAAYATRRERVEGVQADRAQREQARADTIAANQQADLQRHRAEVRQDIQQDTDWGRRVAQAQERRYGQASRDVQQQQRDTLAKEAQQEWAEGGQEWSIHKAKDITERYLPKEPSWKLYDRLDKQAMQPDPVTGKPVDVPVQTPKSGLQEVQENWTKGIDGAPAPLPPAVQTEVDAILQGTDEVTFMGIRNTMKRLGPLTRSKDAEVRRAAKQVFGVLGDALEQAPQASNTLKSANKNWQKETVLGDMREWLEPGGGLVSYDDAGREVIRIGGDSGLLTRVEKQMRTNPMWKRAFTETQRQHLRDEVWQIAGETKMPPLAGPQAGPEYLPGAVANVPNTGDLAVPKPPTMRGLSAPTPEPSPLAPVRPSRVPKLLPGAMPDVPESLQKMPPGRAYETPPVLKAPPAEPVPPRMLPGGSGLRTRPKAATIPPKPERQVPTSVEKPPGFWHEVRGAGAWGGLAFSLQRMGLAPSVIDNGLYAAAAATGTRLVGQRANYLLSQALLNPKYRSLNKHFLTMMDNGQAVVDPKLYNVMLAIMTPEEKRAMDRDTSEKARR